MVLAIYLFTKQEIQKFHSAFPPKVDQTSLQIIRKIYVPCDKVEIVWLFEEDTTYDLRHCTKVTMLTVATHISPTETPRKRRI